MKTPKPPGHALHPLLQMLTGSDRRSIGRSNEVVARVLKEPALLDLLFSGMLWHDPLLAMRCADAAEKVRYPRQSRGLGFVSPSKGQETGVA
jgi:hypothetical protein